jgi:hypothetical protein
VAEKKPIKLGVVFTMPGKMGGYGKHGMQAIQLAIQAEEICRTPAELKEVRINYEKRLKEQKK